PSYKNWAPYVGKAGNNDVVNTEFMKVSSTAKGKPEDLDEIELTEDLLIELMSEKKLHEIRKVCSAAGISSIGTKLECLNRLGDKIRRKDATFNKIFTKFAGSSADKLRRLDLVQELRGCVNTQVAEELFSIINKSRHSLTQLKPLPHVFITRLILHLINERRNRQKLLSLQRTATSSLHEYQLSSGMDGRVSVGPIKNESKPHPAEATRPTAKDSIVAKHGSFYLCTSDMESLNEKGWLTDAVLDAFLHYHLKNKTNIMHVCTQAMTTIFNGEGCHLFNKVC
ncbi:hypothetical protein CAPTEDRAFT_203463, partial [Capitella teleta]